MMRGGLIGMAILLLVGTGDAAAQCWDCGPHLWPADDCWIDSCYWTSSAGNSNCSQYGSCGDIDTCSTNGSGCEGGWGLVLLDGRKQTGMATDHARLVLSQADRLLPEQLHLKAGNGAVYLTLACNGSVAFAAYAPEERIRLRTTTRQLAL